MATTRPFSEFREHGLLWLVNAAVFHPRGFALAFDVEDDGTVTGWGLLGDGTEPWHFEDPPDMDPADPQSLDSVFARVEAFLDSLRPVTED